MKRSILLLTLCAAAGAMATSYATGDQRQAEVARRGSDVMPFSLEATTHIFTKTDRGGKQQVVAKDPSDAHQVELVRKHLREIRLQFLKGDFSAPMHIHGAEMPGLEVIKASKPGQIGIEYKDIEAGAELTYVTSDSRLVRALHQWFDAQLADHGRDAMAGDSQHHDHGSMMKQ